MGEANIVSATSGAYSGIIKKTSSFYDVDWRLMRLVFDPSLNYTVDQLRDEYDCHGIEELIQYQDILADMETAGSMDSDNR